MRVPKFRLILIPALMLVVLSAFSANAFAQRRGYGGYGRRLVVRGGFYGPIYFDPWYRYGYFGYQVGYPYPYGYPYGRYGYIDDLTTSLRLEVTPKTTEVFVDGYLAGTVDDFDGFFQRLRARPGAHELVLYLDGYRAVHQQLYLNPGADQKVRYTMVPLQGGEQPEPRPVPPADLGTPPDNQPGPPPMPGAGRRGGPPPQGQGPGMARRGGPPPRGGQVPLNATFGAVSIRVVPADAEVLIDGEKWSSSAPGPGDRLVVDLSEGRHHVDVQKDGYEKYSNDVQVNRGQILTLNVSLSRRVN